MFNQKHILVIDDDQKLSNLLKSYLNEQGYHVDLAENTAVARDKMHSIIYDLLILDVMLPKESGLVFAATLKRNDKIPILMLSAMGNTNDRIKGLKTGVDEYLPKPFEPEELLLRIKNIIKRNKQIVEEVNLIKIGTFSFNNNKNILYKKNFSIKLTIKESKVLLYLYKYTGNDVERDELAKEINVSTRSVDVLVKRLRSKILSLPQSKNILLTSRGIGYRLDP
jgi:two-component system, OmpR family, phosphate regulon response regulator OmpR